ncbi:MFS transporter [Paenibacillus arenilitoris]|uniref:MFS transporter n=1 Tax=Paenibacillus arenilitoris TaxID=2772299 RepID=A0A927H773_9BACL|nr:MFS transporter [Paenibacillus arenilitoris]MBD2871306.1 MFS transporter [Paenibacillus arenilitoris]
MNNERSLHFVKAFNFFVYGSIAVYSTFFALYLQSVGMTTLEIGALMAGGPVVSIFANPLWGYLSDRFRNVRLILIVMLAGSMLAMQVVFLFQSYTVIYACMLFFFFFQMPLFSQSNSLILNSIEGTKHKFGAFRLFGSLGWALMAVAAGPVIGQIGIKRLWLVYTVMMLITLAFAFTLPRGESKGTSSAGKVRYRSMFANRSFLLFLIVGLVISIPNSMNTTFISLYITELGGHASLIGWSAFWSSIFEIPVFLLLDRYLKKNATTMTLCVVVISALFSLRWFLMSAAAGPEQIIFIQVLHCLTFGGYYYIGTQLTVLLVPAEFRASGQAVYALTWGGLSGIAAGVLGGWLFEQAGPDAMYRVGGFLAAAGIAGFSLLYAHLRRSKPARSKDEALGAL